MNPIKSFALAALTFFACSCGTPSYSGQPIKSGEIWPDDSGTHINAHGGGILFYDNTFYWFGEHKGERSSNAFVGVTCYSSKDLVNWKNEGVALAVEDDPESDIVKGCVMERPKVIYNKKTGKFVMWFHLELKGHGYLAAETNRKSLMAGRAPSSCLSRAKKISICFYGGHLAAETSYRRPLYLAANPIR